MQNVNIASYVAVFVGGGAGSVCRYAAGLLAKRFAGYAFPLSTLCVNLLGCLAIGYISARVERIPLSQISQAARDMMTVGILGGFTTFSAFGYETFSLFRNGAAVTAIANILLNIVLGVLLACLGFWLGSASAKA